MKKILVLVLSMAMLVCAVPHMAFAANTIMTTKIGDFTYVLTSYMGQKLAELQSGNGAMGDIIIPNTVSFGTTNYNVISIGNQAFYNCRDLTSVTIPNSVAFIGKQAFCNCYSLTSAAIYGRVQLIEYQTFCNCNLSSVTIPDSVTTIGKDAFMNNINLTSLTIPDSVTTIGESAFATCRGLTSVTIPGSVTTIGKEAFDGCKGLTSITIPDSVIAIGDRAFYDCYNLESVTIGNNVITIGDRAFARCDSLESIMIPRRVNTIGHQAFGECDSLTSINVTPENPYFESSEDGVLFSRGGEELLMFPCGKIGNYNIPDRVEIIDDYAFASSSLTSVTIGSGVTTIGSYAFWNCKSLQSVEFNNNNVLTDIKICAFGQCSVLRSVALPDSVKIIGDSAFAECGALQAVKIGSTIEHIDIDAFVRCYNLTWITIPFNFDKSKFDDGTGIDVDVDNDNCFYNDGGVQGRFVLV